MLATINHNNKGQGVLELPMPPSPLVSLHTSELMLKLVYRP
jgi:hypothetical protein